MEKTSLKLLLIMLLIGAAFNLSSAPISYPYKISKLNNVPQNDIHYLCQDSRGFIWVGTLDGLHRYDGYDYKTYRMSNDKNTLNSNMICAVDEDSIGNIWIASFDKGICKLNPETEEIVDFSNKIKFQNTSSVYDIEMMCVDANNVLWILHKNFVIRVRLDEKMETVKESTVLLKTTSEAKAIYYDSRGQLWIGALNQLICVLNPYAAKENINKEFYDVHVQDICESENEIIALGRQLYVLKQTNHKAGNGYLLKTYSGINGNGRKVIYHEGRIWIGGRNGVYSYKRGENGWFRDDRFNGDFTSFGLGSNVVFSMLSDSLSGIWVGTRGSGINRIDLNPKRFVHYRNTLSPKSLSNNMVRSIFQDSYGQVWIGTEEEGVNILNDPVDDGFDIGFIHLSVNRNKHADCVYSAVEMSTPGSGEHESIIWLGTSYDSGLVGVNPHTHKIIRSSPTLSQVGFAYAMVVYDSMLWVGTYRNGLWRFLMDDEGHVISSKQFMPDDTKGSLNTDIIRSLLRDSKNNLWIGTDKGLQRIESQEVAKENPIFEDYARITSNTRFGFDYILQIFEDSEGKIWIGTMGNGLLYYNQEASGDDVSFDKLTTKDGLPSNTIKSIVEDDEGHIWLGTNNGISRFNPANKMVINYDVADGLQDVEFSELCGAKLDDGRIIMGGINGFNVFKPEEIFSDVTKSKIYLTEFYVKNKLVEAGQAVNGRIILDKSIEFSKEVKLKYDDNSFSIGFVGIHYKSPNNNNYQYMLEGFDEDWITTSSQNRIANYTNIPAGDYVFKVNASNCDNVWNSKPVELAIRINPPFYLSWNAFVLYFLLMLSGTYFIVGYRRRMEKERQKLFVAELEKKQVEEMSQMRQQFFTNVSHEFKTPLTLIKGPVDRLLKNPKGKAEDRIKNYKLIKQNVGIMMRLISQLMDFRKLDQNVMQLKYANVEVNDYLQGIFNKFRSWAEQKELNFTFQKSMQPVTTTLDIEKMELVIYNLLSNAIKFTPDKGSVSISVNDTNELGTFLITIKDSGMGIPEKDQPRVFERYFQSTDINKQNTGGTGIGLAYSKGLVEKMNGSLSFESIEGVGSSFFVEMPIKNQAPVIEDEPVPHGDGDVEPVGETKGGNEEKELFVSKDRVNILIVEDNYNLRHFIAGEFSDEYNVILAEDGEEGLQKAEENNPDIIVSDIMMPKMDGIEMCRSIKTREQTSHIPVVLLTAKTSEEDQKEGFSTGADAYVPKPFSAEVLKSQIKSILQNREALRGVFQKELKINPMVIANTDVDVKFMEKILEIIEENLSDPEFNIERIAETYGVSRVYLTKKIKALTGEPALQFQRMVRLKHAADRLENSDLTISEIAYDVGYNDLNTFRKRFKEQFEMTPTDYRLKFSQQNKNE